jgi:hypothetical protein
MLLYIDIETLPCSDPDVVVELSKDIQAKTNEKVAAVKAPSNYKDEAKIAEYVESKKNEIYGEASDLLKEAIDKTSFSGLYGSIACICYTFDDGEVFSVDARDGEKKMLQDFYCHILDMTAIDYHGGVAHTEALTIVGHNVAGFDLPFLKHRSIIQNVKPIPALLKAMSAKPWDGCISDTMLMWSSDSQKRASMDKLCKAFGIPGKGDFDGSMVADTWPTEPSKVIGYCMADVQRTRQIYKRLTWA